MLLSLANKKKGIIFFHTILELMVRQILDVGQLSFYFMIRANLIFSSQIAKINQSSKLPSPEEVLMQVSLIIVCYKIQCCCKKTHPVWCWLSGSYMRHIVMCICVLVSKVFRMHKHLNVSLNQILPLCNRVKCKHFTLLPVVCSLFPLFGVEETQKGRGGMFTLLLHRHLIYRSWKFQRRVRI
jgi:hypothetical protein